MKKFLIGFLLLACGPCWGFTQPKTQQLAFAIAKAEGFYLKGSIPNRCANPGDLKAFRNWKQPGQIGVCKGGHVRFRNNAAGWAALRHQIDKIIDNTSGHYSVNMTIAQMGHKYAGNWRAWSRIVSHTLGVTPDTALWEILDVPPILDKNRRKS